MGKTVDTGSEEAEGTAEEEATERTITATPGLDDLKEEEFPTTQTPEPDQPAPVQTNGPDEDDKVSEKPAPEQESNEGGHDEIGEEAETAGQGEKAEKTEGTS